MATGTATRSDASSDVRIDGPSSLERHIAPAVCGAPSRDLLVYIHVPFCAAKCGFCDWVTDIPAKQLTAGSELRQSYSSALISQIRAYGPMLTKLGYSPRYVYWGGGTPSRLDADEMERIGHALLEGFDLSHVAEYTVETSPETLSSRKLEALRSIGVSRISLGVQSWNDDELRRSGRAHTADQAEKALAGIRAAGFENANIDLIEALPDQTAVAWQRSLDRTLAIRPGHITVYTYRAAPSTGFAELISKGRRRLLSYADMAELNAITTDRMAHAGYDEYILGYFAHDASQRFQSERYYFGMKGDYVGFGSGARSILGHHFLHNYSNNLHGYMRQPLAFDLCTRFSPASFDKIASTLRLAMFGDGIDYEAFETLVGFPFAELREDAALRRHLEYFEHCGAVFEETHTRLRILEETRKKAHLKSYVMSLSRPLPRPAGTSSS